jgi:hypothetical protein
MSIYLDPEQTKRHEELIYQCSRFVIEHQGKVVPAKFLVEKFLGEFTKSKETRVRQAMETYANDLLFDKLIISLHDGFLHPTHEQEPLVLEYFRIASQTARSIFYRRSNQMKRVRLDGQFKEVLGRYDKDIFEAYSDYLPDEEKPSEVLKAPVYDITQEIDDELVIPAVIGQQVGMRL